MKKLSILLSCCVAGATFGVVSIKGGVSSKIKELQEQLGFMGHKSSREEALKNLFDLAPRAFEKPVAFMIALQSAKDSVPGFKAQNAYKETTLIVLLGGEDKARTLHNLVSADESAVLASIGILPPLPEDEDAIPQLASALQQIAVAK